MSWSIGLTGTRAEILEQLEANVDLPACVKKGLKATVQAMPDRRYTACTFGSTDGRSGNITLSLEPDDRGGK